MDSRKQLLNAACRLLEKKSFDRLTVQEVLDQSGVSRATFYRHFKDKYDLIQIFYCDRVDEILGRFDGSNMLTLTQEVYTFLLTYRSFFDNVSRFEGDNSFWNFLYVYISDFYKKTYLYNTGSHPLLPEEQYRLHYETAGTISVMKKWIRDGMLLSPEEIARISCHLCPMEYQAHSSQHKIQAQEPLYSY